MVEAREVRDIGILRPFFLTLPHFHSALTKVLTVGLLKSKKGKLPG